MQADHWQKLSSLLQLEKIRKKNDLKQGKNCSVLFEWGLKMHRQKNLSILAIVFY